MPRVVTVAPHLAVEEVAARYRRATDPVARRHWHVVWLLAQGQRVAAVAPVVGYTPAWVREIIHRYNAGGPAGLIDRRHANPGRAPLVPPAVRDELREVLAGSPPDGGRWTSPKVAAWLTERLGRPVSTPRAWETLRALGFTAHRWR